MWPSLNWWCWSMEWVILSSIEHSLPSWKRKPYCGSHPHFLDWSTTFAELSQAFLNRFSLSWVYYENLKLSKCHTAKTTRTIKGVLGLVQYRGYADTRPQPCYGITFHQERLKGKSFGDSLAINPPRSLVEFREWVVGYINMEEVWEMKKAKAGTENGKVEDSKQS